jgi:hypothetical protein
VVKESSDSGVELEQAAESVATVDGSGLRRYTRRREEEKIAFPVVVPFKMVQLSSTTPILGISVKSAIPGIHGTAGQYGCVPLS